MQARDIINAVSIPRYWKEHVRPGEDIEESGFILCPFHDDHNPSMRYNADKKLCKCFTCGNGGTVIDIHMLVFNIRDKQKAIEDLGQRYKVDEHILTEAEVMLEADAAQESINLCATTYKAIALARTLDSPKVYCELDEIMSQTDLASDQLVRLKDFIRRNL